MTHYDFLPVVVCEGSWEQHNVVCDFVLGVNKIKYIVNYSKITSLCNTFSYLNLIIR